MLGVQVHVENEQLSINLFTFYFNIMPIVQYFLLTKSLVNSERAKYLSSVFARMHFVCVDHIQISYHYHENTLHTETCDAYIDEHAGRFYILKMFENSHVLHAETMAKYLVQDRTVAPELVSFIMELSQIFQNEGIQGLTTRYGHIATQPKDDKWMFPNVYLNLVLPSTSSQNEEMSSEVKPIDIPEELIEQVMNEPVPERKPPSRLRAEKDENNPTCFPEKANAVESVEISKPHPSEPSAAPESNVSPSSETTTQSAPARKSKPPASDRDDEKVRSTKKLHSHAATVDISKFTPVEIARFESIRVSTLSDFNLSSPPISSITIHPTNATTDSLIGRQGEQIVFDFLRWKYPKDHVQWMNIKQESCLPYDIRLKKDGQTELIEVKTREAN